MSVYIYRISTEPVKESKYENTDVLRIKFYIKFWVDFFGLVEAEINNISGDEMRWDCPNTYLGRGHPFFFRGATAYQKWSRTRCQLVRCLLLLRLCS